MVSTIAKKLLLWFRRYKVSPTDYSERVGNITKGAEFKTVLEELTEAEAEGTVPTSIVSSTNSFSILVGEEYVISTYILPELASQDYTFVVANPTIAIVSQKGFTISGDNKWEIKGIKAGTTTITFKSKSTPAVTKAVTVTVANLGS